MTTKGKEGAEQRTEALAPAPAWAPAESKAMQYSRPESMSQSHHLHGIATKHPKVVVVLSQPKDEVQTLQSRRESGAERSKVDQSKATQTQPRQQDVTNPCLRL